MDTAKNKHELTEKQFLETYNPEDYEKLSATVDVLLLTIDKKLNSLKVLLIKRNNYPYKNCWALPGGFVGIQESAFEAANRELKEKTGLEDLYLEQLYTYTQPKRDPRMRIISIAYMALVPIDQASGKKAEIKVGAEAAWFDVYVNNNVLSLKNEEKGITMEYRLEDKTFKIGAIKYNNYVPALISEDRLAFDHDLIILDGIMRLRNKAEYTDVVFNLMQKKFALSDLQKAYELVLGHELYKKNFRDKIKENVVETKEKGLSIIGGRMSTLYKYKKAAK